MGRLFGTDGIRGRANHYPITCEIALKTGRAVGLLSLKTGATSILVGKDTRQSGDMLESAIAAGATSVGADVKRVGVIPTPAVAYLVSHLSDVGMGIMISASHNPYGDNGIKIFGAGGLKLSDEEQEFVENYILDTQEPDVSQKKIGELSFFSEAYAKYAHFLKSKFPNMKPPRPLKLVVDASNGSASPVAPMVFDNADAFSVHMIHNHPNGKNINLNCGSQHIEDLIETVLKTKADIGLAFDGDADRLIAVDEKGLPITGDRILAICANYAKEHN
ncbi:MAG: phosphoglucosamine mutase, partial [Desulfovibrionales bacterium]|nr:phosphoglucosamine mutase [Desulfovibrionales bacterium]